MNPIRVASLDDPRLAPYRNVRDAHLRMNEPSPDGLLMAEGEVVVRQLIESPIEVHSVLVTPTRLQTVSDALERLDVETPVYLVKQEVMDGVTGFHIHRGLLAAGVRPPPASPESIVMSALADKGRGPILILEDLANHDNVGGIFRNAAAFGCAGVLLSPGCADPLYRKAIRVSCGQALQIPFGICTDWPGDLEAVASSFEVVALAVSEGSVPIDEAVGTLRGRRIALLAGAEGPGLSDAALSASSVRVRIPIRSSVDSLNVATACGIALHRFCND